MPLTLNGLGQSRRLYAEPEGDVDADTRLKQIADLYRRRITDLNGKIHSSSVEHPAEIFRGEMDGTLSTEKANERREQCRKATDALRAQLKSLEESYAKATVGLRP